jgi:hypothetical protein
VTIPSQNSFPMTKQLVHYVFHKLYNVMNMLLLEDFRKHVGETQWSVMAVSYVGVVQRLV